MDDQYQALSQEMIHLFRTMKHESMVQLKSQHGLHHGQGHVLGVLTKHQQMSQKELAQRLSIRPASLTDLLEKLEKERLVVREHDTKDRRVVRVSITPKGRQLVKQNDQVRRQVEQTMFGALSDEEIQVITRIFHKMAVSLEAGHNGQEDNE